MIKIGLIASELPGVKGSTWLIYEPDGSFQVATIVKVGEVIHQERQQNRDTKVLSLEETHAILKLEIARLTKIAEGLSHA